MANGKWVGCTQTNRFHACFSYSTACLRFLGLHPLRFRSTWLDKDQGKHAQYGYARLNQCTVLHAEKPILEQVTFRLSAMVMVPINKQGHPSHEGN